MNEPANTLIPVIAYLENAVFNAEPLWSKKSADNDTGLVSNDFKKGHVGKYAGLVSAFARAVKVAADSSLNIKLPCMIGDSIFEDRLRQINEHLSTAFQKAALAHVDAKDVETKEVQMVQLGDAQVKMVEAINAYELNKVAIVIKLKSTH